MTATISDHTAATVQIQRRTLDSLPEKLDALELALSNLSSNERPDRELAELYRIASEMTAASAPECGDTIDSGPTPSTDPAEASVANALREMGDALVVMLRDDLN